MKKSILIFIVMFVGHFCIAQWQPTNGPFSGAIHSVIVSNNEIIVGTQYIYKSTDNGRTWNISNNGISGSVSSVRSLVKINANLVAGTDAGAFYSNDNGNNWIQCAGTSGLNVWFMITKGSNVFMSTSGNGVYKSTNNGVTWSAVNTGITTPFMDMRSLAVKGSDIYAGTDGYGIFKSTNDGSQWTLVNTGLPGSYYSVSALAVSGNTILAGTYGAGVYKSADNGSHWTAINSSGISSTDDILAMGVNGNTIYASTLTGNLYKTTDYTNWDAVSPGNFTSTRYEAFYSTTGAFYVGSWGYGSPEQSYGLFKTADDGITWKHVGITDYPVSVLEVSGNNIFAGTNDITGNSARIPLFKTTESDSMWSFNIGGFVGRNITALKASGNTMYLFDDEGPGQSLVYRSTNNGNNWISTGFNVLYSNFVSFSIAGTMIYAADNSSYSSAGVYVSSDNGASWNSVNSGIPSSVHKTYGLVLKGTTLFLATDYGVYKNTVGQNAWTAVNTGLTNMIIKSICVSANDMYVGTEGGGIFKSVNNGGQWAEVNSGVPLFADVRCFAVSGGNIIAGTDQGIFVSSNTGNSWTNVNSGLKDSTITALTVSANYLWAGTSSHGVWRRQISQMIGGSAPPMPGNIQGSSTVCPGSTHTFSVSPVSGATSYTWTLPNGWTGSSSSESIDATAGQSGTISVTANNGYGSSSPRTFNVSVTSVNTGVTQSGLTLTADASGAGYVWINCLNNTPVSGQTIQSFTATTAGNYAVIVTQNGCTDTSLCFFADTVCHTTISGSDMPFTGLEVLLYVDTTTNVALGNPGISQNWDYSSLLQHYPKFAQYNSTSSTAFATDFPNSNIYTYGPGSMYGSLFGGAPVGTGNNGYVFWESDNSGFWVTGFRPDGGIAAGINVYDNPHELLIGVPASYGSIFNNSARWELPLNRNTADPDTFYVRNITKTIIADACGSLTTPFGVYPNVLREHEYLIAIDSIYMKTGGILIPYMEYRRDTSNNYMYLSAGIGYPACIVHADRQNRVKDVEYYSGVPFGISNSLSEGEGFLLYPNPSSENITIEIPQTSIKEGTVITAFSIQGQILLQQSAEQIKTVLDIKDFAKGVYVIRLSNSESTQTKRFLKE